MKAFQAEEQPLQSHRRSSSAWQHQRGAMDEPEVILIVGMGQILIRVVSSVLELLLQTGM